jgi:hypothetical protein
VRRLLLLTTVLLLGTALPASAKMLPFDMEVDTRGDIAHVEVTITGDPSLIDGFDTPQLDGLIAMFPADQVDEDGRPQYALKEVTDVPLSRVGPGNYRGSVALDPGRWAVVPFPHTVGALWVKDAYPQTITIEIRDEGSAVWALAAVGALMAIAWRFRDHVHV